MAHVTSTPALFTVGAAACAMTAACEIAGLDADGARLIRLGENALFHLPAPGIVVRIARSMSFWPDVAREIAVARWLGRQAFPAARACDMDQPVKAAGRPASFWHFIAGRNGSREDIEELAVLLRRLHHLPGPADFNLPAENILGRVRGRVEAAAVTATDRNFLLRRLEDLEAALPSLRWPLVAAPTHGDAHVQNLMITSDGPVLIDFERFAFGQPEWDLAMTATEYQTAGWWTASEYARFCAAYGYDVTSWSGFPVLRAVHEIKMVSWLAQNVGESPDIAREFATRMRTIRGQGSRERWHPF